MNATIRTHDAPDRAPAPDRGPAFDRHQAADRNPASISSTDLRPDGSLPEARLPSVTAHIRPRWALPPHLVDALAQMGKPRSVSAGSVFAHEGDAPDNIHLILSGRIRGFVSDDEDRRLVLGELGVGEYCGEMLIDGFDRCVSTIALEPTRLVAIPRAVFMQAMSRDSELLLHVMQKLAKRLSTSTELVRRLALADVRHRVQHFLLEAASALGRHDTPVGISQQAIADRVGATRSMVNRVLKSMTQDGDVEATANGFVLKRIPAPIALPRLPAAQGGHFAADGEPRPDRSGITPLTPALLPTRKLNALLQLPTDLIDEVRSRGRVAHYAPGEFVCREGTVADQFHVLVRGRLHVTLSSVNGRSFALGDVGPGEYLGEMVIVDGAERLASVEAIEPSELVHLSRAELLELVEQRSDFARHMAVRLSMRLRQLTNLAKQLALLDVQSRMLMLFEELGERAIDGSLRIAKPPSQQEIGERVGASRSMINRVMRELSDQGVIVQREGALVIRSAQQLKRA